MSSDKRYEGPPVQVEIRISRNEAMKRLLAGQRDPSPAWIGWLDWWWRLLAGREA
jgi:hypothetical protein